ncbi:hypothetical protein [Acidaminobacter hydrogenoformans]|uniref:SD-repeat containing protein B domain-containing protein n=1 Tax=Acidaminobacter hydrogenoformans DSM 2784 TaxID=1120920 RepID=A0A1G5RQS1_9FIRM|nr:hypothetical protein [Acidaminobacter hydrogenoformans]SCZ76384.1 hypothetical protein SAMN03080599_00209 [Acidaminobacter hydrogenoformans DSM 2784]
MSDYHIIKSSRRRLMPLLLLLVMILAMLPMGSFAADETLYGYRVNYNNTQTQITNNIGWYNAQLGNGWAEGDWVPYQLVITGLDGIDDLSRIAVAYDFFLEIKNDELQDGAVLVDLVRGFQIRSTSNAGQNIMLTDSQMGYPSSQTSPINIVDEMEAAQTNNDVGLWTGFDSIDVPKEQINVGFDGTTFVPLTPTDSVAHFYITKQQLVEAGVPADVKSIVLYFQLHLARTSLWSSGLFQNYGNEGVPAEEWGGHIYKEGTVFDGVTYYGSYYYPGASGHAKLIGATRTVPIPVPSQNLGSVTGIKWHDMDGDGIKDAEEAFLANWPIYITADIEGMSFVLSTMTDANGVYSFPTLTYGTRYITEGATRGSETGWSQTFPVGEFDVTQPFGGFDSYNDYLNDIAEGSGVELGDQGYEIVIDRNNYAFSSMNFGNRMTGDLEITKLFDYEDVEGFEDSMLPDSIDIHITGPSFLPDGEDFSLPKEDDYYLLLENLLPGDYSITEINVPDGWDDPNVPINVTVIVGDVVDVEFTNVFMTGEFKITKAFDFEGVEGFDKATMLPMKITVLVTGPSYPGPDGKEFDIDIDEEGLGELLLENLIPGEYFVDELEFTGSDMWDSDIDPASVEVEAGALEVVEVSITNTFMTGELLITKAFDFEGVEGFDKATMLPMKITILVTGPSYPAPDGKEFDIDIDEEGLGDLLLENLIPGEYFVDELEFTGSDMWDSDIDPASVDVEAGAAEAVEVSITNTFMTGELLITKAFDFEGVEGFDKATMLPMKITVLVTGPSYPAPDGKEFDIDIDEEGLGELLLENLIPGEYFVDELEFTGSDMWDSDIDPASVDVEAGAAEAVEVSITNTFMTGELKIIKNFVDGMSGMYPEFIQVKVTGPSFPAPEGDVFDIDIDPITGSGEIILDKLIPGAYTVSELTFEGSGVWSSSISGSPASVAANADVTVTVTITNTMQYHDETAWAFGENENRDFSKSGNWGWNIGPIEEGYSERHELIAGAGGNIVENGTLVGHVDIDYTGGIVTVTYHMLEGFELMDTHVWIGETNLPTLKNGKMTDSPGQFPYEDGASVAASGEVYVAAHAVVRMPGN